MQVDAVMKMLNLVVNIRLVSPKRRNLGNRWLKRRTLYRSAVDILRQADRPMTAREIADALTREGPEADVQASRQATSGRLAALRKRNGKTVTGEGSAAR